MRTAGTIKARGLEPESAQYSGHLVCHTDSHSHTESMYAQGWVMHLTRPLIPVRPEFNEARGPCTCCKKSLDATAFAWNQSKCHQCKASYDAIYGICKRKDELQWLNELKEDPDKLSTLVLNYRQCNDLHKVGEGNKWTVAHIQLQDACPVQREAEQRTGI
eukprot:1809664-Amphidinium_carterae.1